MFSSPTPNIRKFVTCFAGCTYTSNGYIHYSKLLSGLKVHFNNHLLQELSVQSQL